MQTPMLDKMESIKKDSQICGEFLEWLMSKFHMMNKHEPRENLYVEPYTSHFSIEGLLAEYFDIDLVKVEKEKQQILNEIRTQ
jgi:hypothetical protein